jgi:hypothetical protein
LHTAQTLLTAFGQSAASHALLALQLENAEQQFDTQLLCFEVKPVNCSAGQDCARTGVVMPCNSTTLARSKSHRNVDAHGKAF